MKPLSSSFRTTIQPLEMKTGRCQVHFDDNWDGKIEINKFFNFIIETPELCKELCRRAQFSGCRYTDNAKCLYYITLQEFRGNGPFYYECEIINDGKIYEIGLCMRRSFP